MFLGKIVIEVWLGSIYLLIPKLHILPFAILCPFIMLCQMTCSTLFAYFAQWAIQTAPFLFPFIAFILPNLFWYSKLYQISFGTCPTGLTTKKRSFMLVYRLPLDWGRLTPRKGGKCYTLVHSDAELYAFLTLVWIVLISALELPTYPHR